MSACIAAYFNSFITCLAKELHQTRHWAPKHLPTWILVLSQLRSGWFLHARSYSYCPAWLPGPFWLHQEDIFYQPAQNQSSYTASIRPPQCHDSEYTKELDNSSLFLGDIITARCKKWIPVSRKAGPTHLREMSHWEREIPKPLAAFYSICRAAVSKGGGLFRVHIVQGLLTRSLQRFTCPPAQDKGTTSQLKLRLNRLQGLADKHRVPV